MFRTISMFHLQTIFNDISYQRRYNLGLGIRPHCPIRWLCRLSVISSFTQNYTSVLKSLDSMSIGAADLAAFIR